MAPVEDLEIAIVGGGIAGLTLARGLLRHGIKTSIYERGKSFREIGAGIGFTPNAERAMKVLDPEIHKAFKSVTVQNGTDWFMWVDGSGCDRDSGHDKIIHQMYLGERGFEGCARADFLDELVKLLPKDCVQFSKCLESVTDNKEEAKIKLHFSDGSATEADIVVGCDGIRSRVRDFIQDGLMGPKAYATYSHKYACRGLIPMEKALAALGSAKTDTRHMYLGPGGVALTFPVAGGKLLNVVAFVSDPNEWPDPDKFTTPTNKTEALYAFRDFGPTVQSIIALLPEELSKWAVFDMYDNPLQTFVKGRICVTGDAAHAAAPYHGAGAGFAIEDGAVLCCLLAMVVDRLQVQMDVGQANQGLASEKSLFLRKALEVYQSVRYDRAQWLVHTSRFVGNMYQWQDAQIGGDHAQLAKEIDWRCQKIWHFDVDEMIRKTRLHFQKSLGVSKAED